jgi:hypothetical protein
VGREADWPQTEDRKRIQTVRCVGLEVLTEVVINIAIFWNIASCSSPCRIVERWFLARAILNSEDGSEIVLRNTVSLTHYTALFPRRWQHS